MLFVCCWLTALLRAAFECLAEVSRGSAISGRRLRRNQLTDVEADDKTMIWIALTEKDVR
jgi:hypothetical protein